MFAEPRGPLSAALVRHLRATPHRLAVDALPIDDPCVGDDTHLALHCCYELHYRGLPGVDPEWEWEPSLLALRARLERRFLETLTRPPGAAPPADGVPAALRDLIDGTDGPSLSAYVGDRGSIDQIREFAIHRSIYQLKEADPHTWGLPRLTGRPKSAMVKIQADEYGNGEPGRTHAELFATTMRALGLDATYGAYLDEVPGVTLATGNLISLFGLHRRWRGALVGHLAAFEMTSIVPMSRYAAAIRRVLDAGADSAAEFYEIHVEADAEHERIAANDLAGGLAKAEPELIGDILFGAAALLQVEQRFAEHVLRSWHQERSSLRQAGRLTSLASSS
jgi:hypothetical protein